jgi:hypothetical protein
MSDEPDEGDDARRPDLPAGLEGEGRDESLTRDRDIHPTGLRADNRASVPGTAIPDAPEPAAQEGETERVVRGSETEHSA